ncbi:gene transfer agent family protein [uncultured Cohaesibacter sp.]|uniref:gene transfer agent family protein n=1 Tax=uncultured Cohaesibacter sp. TaxID=1002546 RepID=UPI0029C86A78|nr:gene transfer agent family protein [uncultured Cohaesibacter sp.]
MANRRRGEVTLILDGKPRVLCLTLGALAELEDSMGLDNIGELADRFASGRVCSADLVKILGTALRAGGEEIADREAASMRCEGGATALTHALVEVLRLAFDPSASLKADDGGAEKSSANPT